jgi:hypothetical protein
VHDPVFSNMYADRAAAAKIGVFFDEGMSLLNDLLLFSYQIQRLVSSEELRKAEQTLPDLCKCHTTFFRLTYNSTLVFGLRPPRPDEYEQILWYPGLDAVERRRQEYISEHPEILATSDPL